MAILATVKKKNYVQNATGCLTRRNTTTISNIGSTITSSSIPDTQPPSSLSNFKFFDNTQPSTPFTITPLSSPSKPLSVPLLNKEPAMKNILMASKHMASFHGDKDDESPSDFL